MAVTMKLYSLIFFVVLATPSVTFAFEVNGFIGGMRAEYALQFLRERSETVSEVGGSTEIEQTYLASFQGRSAIESITICRGRLHSYQCDISGGMRAFVRLVQVEQATFGQGNGEGISRETRVG